MNNIDEHLKNYLREQIALEEHLHSVVNQQIEEINDDEFTDAKDLLIKTKEVLERHFAPLNEILDRIEKDAANALIKAAASNPGSHNGKGALILPGHKEKQTQLLSRMLRDDYSALNLITMSNTLLHTTALAFNCQEVAAISLKHIQNLAPLVVRIGELAPEVITRELHSKSPKINLAVAQTALKNIQSAWRSAT